MVNEKPLQGGGARSNPYGADPLAGGERTLKERFPPSVSGHGAVDFGGEFLIVR
jgi:hypothetical protein